jgi:hypothetical protein
MDKTTKTLLIVLGSLFLICVCAAAVLMGTGLWGFSRFAQFADQSTTEDPQEVATIASEIADFSLPEGFDTQYGMKISTFSLVQYTAPSQNTYIFLSQFPAGTSIDPDEMMRQIKEGVRHPNSPWYNIDSQLVEQKPVTIRGEETTLSVSEGTSDNGELYRMVNAKFQGKGRGPSLLMIIGPADQWDTGMVDNFIASIQ